MIDKTIKIHDHGYVRLVDAYGSDINVVNAARTSFSKESIELTEKDIKLIKYLARNQEDSPFRHAALWFELYAPLMICRQWLKYVVASSHVDDQLSHNESSRRYLTEDPVFYIPQPGEWRSSPENKKQGSGEPAEIRIGKEAMERLIKQINYGQENYNWALENNICAEQSRLFISSAYGLMVRWRWFTSLSAVAHMLNQRLEHKAQKEFTDYAKAVYTLTKEQFPVSVQELVNYAEER